MHQQADDGVQMHINGWTFGIYPREHLQWGVALYPFFSSANEIMGFFFSNCGMVG